MFVTVKHTLEVLLGHLRTDVPSIPLGDRVTRAVVQEHRRSKYKDLRTGIPRCFTTWWAMTKRTASRIPVRGELNNILEKFLLPHSQIDTYGLHEDQILPFGRTPGDDSWTMAIQFPV